MGEEEVEVERRNCSRHFGKQGAKEGGGAAGRQFAAPATNGQPETPTLPTCRPGRGRGLWGWSLMPPTASGKIAKNIVGGGVGGGRRAADFLFASPAPAGSDLGSPVALRTIKLLLKPRLVVFRCLTR